MLCWLLGHRERMMTIGRGGYVAWFTCRRSCGWSAVRKGAWRW